MLSLLNFINKNNITISQEFREFIEESGDSDIHYEKIYGHNALTYASKNGHFEIVKFLINHDIDINNANFVGFTALTYASLYENLRLVKYLIKHGACTDNDSSLWFALHYNYIKVVKYLIKNRARIHTIYPKDFKYIIKIVLKRIKI